METTVQSSSKPAGRPLLDPERWVGEHSDELYRYALSRVTQPETARDLVQETFLAAWRSSDQFAGKSSERTWLFRIMRNKIADHYRKKRPEFAVDNLNELAELEQKQFQQTGMHRGAWAAAVSPSKWEDATQSMQTAEFWKIVHQCADKLPSKVATVFTMREIDGQSSDEICAALEINRSHLGVLMHRARLAMRRCLELNWFRPPSHPFNPL